MHKEASFPFVPKLKLITNAKADIRFICQRLIPYIIYSPSIRDLARFSSAKQNSLMNKNQLFSVLKIYNN